jgi:hypothetical protein
MIILRLSIALIGEVSQISAQSSRAWEGGAGREGGEREERGREEQGGRVKGGKMMGGGGRKVAR